jgi:hypothetical protein
MSTHAQEVRRTVAEFTATDKGILAPDESSGAIERYLKSVNVLCASPRRSWTCDPEALAGFANSWCRYDWPGADLIAADGHRGHYVRRRTLSAGDPVCDMCWVARARRETNENDQEDS